MYYGKPNFIKNLKEYTYNGITFHCSDLVEIFRGKNIGTMGLLVVISQYKEFIGVTIETEESKVVLSYIKNIKLVKSDYSEKSEIFLPEDLFRIE